MVYVPQLNDIKDKGGDQLVRARALGAGQWLVYGDDGDSVGAVTKTKTGYQAHTMGREWGKRQVTVQDAICLLLSPAECKTFRGV